MSQRSFKAMVVTELPDNKFVRQISERSVDDLPQGDVLIRVNYSSLNYKDALSATGNKGVTRKYPHTPGIDAAGVVEESTSDAFKPGDEVVVTGYDLGMNTSGGFGQYIRVPAGWVVPRPAGLSLKECMSYGTAGFTAAQCVKKILDSGITPDHGEILVTGSTGGVGSVAVAILAKLGFYVVAVTGKEDQKPFLQHLGATSIMSRAEASDESNRPLLKARWAGVVDTVGGNILSTAIKSTQQHGTITCCGNAASPDLPLTVFPFILRGVALLGVDSANCPMPARLKIWEKLSTEWKLSQLADLVTEISLSELDHHIDLILKGQEKGRVVVNLLK